MANSPKTFWWVVASCGLMILGSFGPWARVLGIVSVNGTDGGDGWIVIVAAVIAGGLLILKQTKGLGWWPVLVALLAAILAAATSLYDWTDLKHVADQTGLISAGWGIYLATIGSFSLTAACVGYYLETRGPIEEPVSPPAPSSE